MNVDLAKLREIEDEVKKVLDDWPKLKLLIAYGYINRGSKITMEGLDRNILQEFAKQQREGR